VAYYRDIKLLEDFGKRVKAFRQAAELSQEQIQYATGISQSNIYSIELGKLNTSLSQAGLLADFFGVPLSELVNFKSAIPDSEILKKGIDIYLKKKKIDPKIYLKKGLAKLLRDRVLKSKFLSTPRYTKDIADYIHETLNTKFTTSALSQALENLHKQGLIEKISTEKKSKFQYRKL
jgi:transcriptional regulator with XRE-family HTH domain